MNNVRGFSVSALLVLIAIICFVLAIFAPVGGFSFQDLIAVGLTFFAAAHLV